MLALLIRAAPLSEKCKRSCTVENGVHATLNSVRPRLSLNVSEISLSSVPSSKLEVISPSPIVKMSCAASRTLVPASIISTDHRFITLYDGTPVSDANRTSKNPAICITTRDLEGPTVKKSPSIANTTSTHILHPLSSSGKHQHDGVAAADTLRWCEARRTGSEPVGLQSWLSNASLECERDDDDVFTVTDSNVWCVCEDPEDSFSGKGIYSYIIEYSCSYRAFHTLMIFPFNLQMMNAGWMVGKSLSFHPKRLFLQVSSHTTVRKLSSGMLS